MHRGNSQKLGQEKRRERPSRDREKIQSRPKGVSHPALPALVEQRRPDVAGFFQNGKGGDRVAVPPEEERKRIAAARRALRYGNVEAKEILNKS